jgi:hypothetical protein
MWASGKDHLVLDYGAIAAKVTEDRPANMEAKDTTRIANISAVAPVDEDLWTASDEGASLERLTRRAARFSRAENFDLVTLFPTFKAACAKISRRGDAAKKLEADLEGLAWDGERRRLWLVGSHCRSRGSLDKVKPAQLCKRVGRVLDTAPLRTLLGFVPLRDDGRPAANSGLALQLGEEKGSLRTAIESEGGYLAEALKWPAKENGLDIEGIAVDDTDVLLGLRGPAAGGFAIVMRLSVEIGKKALSLRKRNGRRCRLSFLHLNGLGIRDLARQGDDVLVLAGPSMDLDAPFALYRWRGAFGRASAKDEKVKTGTGHLEFLFDFEPAKRLAQAGRAHPCERPEGIGLVDKSKLIVVHDRPYEWRLRPNGTLTADLVDLPEAGEPRRRAKKRAARP